jgi:hydroxypyruvate isomerase
VTALGERAGVIFCLENLNTAVDHPGVPFARAADTMALVEAVGRPGLDDAGPVPRPDRRGEPDRAAAPGRPADRRGPGGRRPRALRAGTGEINYPAVAGALDDMGYRGTVGLEAWASGDSEQALARFRAALTGSQAPGSRGDRQ